MRFFLAVLYGIIRESESSRARRHMEMLREDKNQLEVVVTLLGSYPMVAVVGASLPLLNC